MREVAVSALTGWGYGGGIEVGEGAKVEGKNNRMEPLGSPLRHDFHFSQSRMKSSGKNWLKRVALIEP
jgi:hypothetical protein